MSHLLLSALLFALAAAAHGQEQAAAEWIRPEVVPARALALASHRRLGEAGITIPFPQRDLHLASVSPEVSAVLAEGGRGAGSRAKLDALLAERWAGDPCTF